jgi:hypothetical protein
MSGVFPMLVMTGKVDNVYVAPEGVNKKSGESYGGGSKVQLLVDIPQQNGETKRGLVTLSTTHPDYFRLVQDQRVSLPVGAMPVGKDVLFYILKGWRPPIVGVASEATQKAVQPQGSAL